MIRALEGNDDGVKVGGRILPALRFADDQAMIAGTEEALQNIMNKLAQVSENCGMKINIKKTKTLMVVSKNERH